ncbi:THAP domain-containing protein 7, partial [Polyodon spathula]|uniref:THAP domain-containing protein 7 n=1 Tax=Polyodon spathula TaxID=7913 RepID=UPI001B7E121E
LARSGGEGRGSSFFFFSRRGRWSERAAILVRSAQLGKGCRDRLAAGCKSRDTRETRRGGTTFHRLPKRGNPRRTLWLLSCRRTDPQGNGMWDPQSQFIYFCSKHFSKDCFELVGTSGYHRLKDEALPTIFEPFSKLRRAARSKRASKRRGEERDTPAWLPQRGSAIEPLSTQSQGYEPPPRSRGRPPPRLHPRPGLVLGRPPAGATPPAPISSWGPPPRSRPRPRTSLLPEDEEGEGEGEEPARPASPSIYMARLPPPPGSYIAREHSYGVQSPLCWRARAEAAREGLERAHRQLAAARRRELRLRHRLAVLLQERRSGGKEEGGEPDPGLPRDPQTSVGRGQTGGEGPGDPGPKPPPISGGLDAEAASAGVLDELVSDSRRRRAVH